MRFGDVAAQAFQLRHRLGQILPARVRHLAEADAQRQFAVAAEGQADMRGELAEIADLAFGLDDSAYSATGESAGASISWAAPLGGMTSAFFLRRLKVSRRKGAISVVVSSQTISLPIGTTLMTWSNCEGEGRSGSILRLELMSAEEA